MAIYECHRCVSKFKTDTNSSFVCNHIADTASHRIRNNIFLNKFWSKNNYIQIFVSIY